MSEELSLLISCITNLASSPHGREVVGFSKKERVDSGICMTPTHRGIKASEAQDWSQLYAYLRTFAVCMYLWSVVLSFEACQRLLLVLSSLFW